MRDVSTRAEGMEQQLKEAKGGNKEEQDRFRQVEVENEELKLRLAEATSKLKVKFSALFSVSNIIIILWI